MLAILHLLVMVGAAIDVNSRQKSLIENFRDWHRNGADLDPKTGYVKKL